MNYVLVGYGRMGRAIDRIAADRAHHGVGVIAGDARDLPPEGSVPPPDVAFEFTRGDQAEANVVRWLRRGVSVVCGTTGWEPGLEVERACSESGRGLVIAPNFSPGVRLFYGIVDAAARVVGRAGLHKPYLLELHHEGKRDAPSGTARRLAEIVLEADDRIDAVCEGNPDGALPAHTLHVSSVRVGSEPGTHEVGFDGEHDEIVLRHRARGRSGFALGAVLAAEWIVGHPGRHEFDEVLDALWRGDAPSPQGGRT